jgi:hypothetical protein
MATKKTVASAKAEADSTKNALANRNAYLRARDNGHKDYLKRASRFNQYYLGEQWDESTLAKLRVGNRPAHTINLILSTVNAVMGEYLSKRQEITLKPVSGNATPKTADLLARQLDQIQENNKSKWNEATVVLDGLVEERGYFDIRMSYDDNIKGEVRETVLDPRDVMLDPGAKEYDPSTWNEVIVSRWWTIDEVEAVYGQAKADKLRRMPKSGSAYGADDIEFETDTFAQDKGKYLDGEPMGHSSDDDGYGEVRRVRVIDRQFWKLGDAYCFVDPVFGDERDVPRSWDETARDAFAQQWGLIIYRKVKRMVRWCVSAADVELFYDWSPYDRFTVIPYFPYFRRGRPIGLVTNLVGPQDLLNKTASQELHVVNTSANSGWIFESGSLVNMTREELGAVGAQTGLVLEFARGSTPPEKIQPNQIPSGLDRMTDKAGQWFRMISGVSDSFLGQPGREISGVALDAKNQGVQVQLEVVFDNLAKTRQLRAEAMLALVQRFYTEERTLRLVSRDIDGDEEHEEVLLNQYLEAADEIVNDLTIGEYKIVVSSIPVRDTQDESTFAQLMQLKEAGVLIPDFAVLEATNLSIKDELVQYAKKMAGMLEPTPEELAKQQMLEEIQMRAMLAEAAEKESKAQLNAANIQLLMAKAQSEGQKIPAEMEKMGAQLRVEMERMALEAQMHREDLQNRYQISKEKNAMGLQTAQVNAMVARVEEAAAERKDQRATLSKAGELSLRSREIDAQQVMQQKQLAHDRRQADIENAMRAKEMEHERQMSEREFQLKQKENEQKLALAKKQGEQKLQLQKQQGQQQMKIAKQTATATAKAKTAKAKPTAKRK